MNEASHPNQELGWNTAITETAPNAIRVRGYAADALMGRVSFAQAIYLVLRGELPTDTEGALLDAILVACIDHGATPPSTLAARTAASTGAPLNAALAAGILSINAHHGGAIEASMRLFREVRSVQGAQGIMVEAAARQVMDAYRAEGRRLPGFGHRLHVQDPRSTRLLRLAADAEIPETYLVISQTLETLLEVSTGRPLPLNVDGAIAAVLSALGFAPELANAFFIMARVPGLVAHVVEEQTRQKPVRRIHPTHHAYDGPPPRTLP